MHSILKCTRRINCMKAKWKKKKKHQIWPNNSFMLFNRFTHENALMLCYATRSFRFVRKFYNKKSKSLFIWKRNIKKDLNDSHWNCFLWRGRKKNQHQRNFKLKWKKQHNDYYYYYGVRGSSWQLRGHVKQMSCHHSTIIIFSPRLNRYSVLWLHNKTVVAHRLYTFQHSSE